MEKDFNEKPNNHLALAIISTILCCWPFGIPAIINAVKVDNLWLSGHQDEACEAAAKAKKWSIVSMVCALVFWIIYVIIYAVYIGVLVAFS
jgi:hypothetical protein